MIAFKARVKEPYEIYMRRPEDPAEPYALNPGEEVGMKLNWPGSPKPEWAETEGESATATAWQWGRSLSQVNSAYVSLKAATDEARFTRRIGSDLNVADTKHRGTAMRSSNNCGPRANRARRQMTQPGQPCSPSISLSPSRMAHASSTMCGSRTRTQVMMRQIGRIWRGMFFGRIKISLGVVFTQRTHRTPAHGHY